ncbi:MAG: hypothetical protein LBC99_02685 [Spirochaetota bacterium]|jgi:hypothetical protein|nr:hypothetical protein [Spirochaetota bacterium]
MKKTIPAFVCVLILAFSLYGAVSFEDSYIRFSVIGLEALWGNNPRCFATMQKTAAGYDLVLTANQGANNDTVRITVALPDDPPRERLRNSSRIVLNFAGTTYQGFVTVFLDPIPEAGGFVTGKFEDCTLTWPGWDVTRPVGEGIFHLVRTK